MDPTPNNHSPARRYDYDIPRHPGANGLVALTGEQVPAETSVRHRADERLAESARMLREPVAR